MSGDRDGSGSDGGPEATVDGSGGPESDGDDDMNAVFGPRPHESAVEVVPGDPDLENAVFVALGALVALALVLELLGVV